MPWTPKYPMGLTQVPKPMALTPFVMLSFQCLVASSLGQSMPHSCSFRDPIGFTFSLSGYMPATKKTLRSPAGSADSDSFAVKICSIRRSQFQRQMWDQAQNHQKNRSSAHFETTWFIAFYSFHPISFTRSSRGPSHHKSGSLNNKYEYHSASQSTAENHLPMYETLASSRQRHSQNDAKTLPGPRPSLLAASTVAFAEISCSTTSQWPLWAAHCSAVTPRRRGCEADGGAAAAAVERQSVWSWDVSPGGWAKFWI